MDVTTSILPPQISFMFNKDLLSTPIFRYDSKNLHWISNFLERKLLRPEFKGFVKTKNKIYIKYLQFMELCEYVKIKEKECEGKAYIKAKSPFYRPRLSNQIDRTILERLDRRIKTSERDRRNN